MKSTGPAHWVMARPRDDNHNHSHPAAFEIEKKLQEMINNKEIPLFDFFVNYNSVLSNQIVCVQINNASFSVHEGDDLTQVATDVLEVVTSLARKCCIDSNIRVLDSFYTTIRPPAEKAAA